MGNPPVVSPKAHALADEHVKAHATGFTAHLTKPLNVSKLLSTVTNVLEGVSLTQLAGKGKGQSPGRQSLLVTFD